MWLRTPEFLTPASQTARQQFKFQTCFLQQCCKKLCPITPQNSIIFNRAADSVKTWSRLGRKQSKLCCVLSAIKWIRYRIQRFKGTQNKIEPMTAKMDRFFFFLWNRYYFVLKAVFGWLQVRKIACQLHCDNWQWKQPKLARFAPALVQDNGCISAHWQRLLHLHWTNSWQLCKGGRGKLGWPFPIEFIWRAR